MKAYLSRRYHLSASHRLHVETLSHEENRTVFGKCNNPHGHGHNYTVEVTFSGAVDPVTGMVADLAELDAFARVHLLEKFNTTNLNTLSEFNSVVPTTENLTLELHRIFAAFPQAQLERVHVRETSNNSFSFDGGESAPSGRN